MDVSKTIASQFHAALSMMEETVRTCPDELWNEPDQATPFWRVAYHALFYVNFYLQTTEHDHALWEGAREGYQFLARRPSHHMRKRRPINLIPQRDPGLSRILPRRGRQDGAND